MRLRLIRFHTSPVDTLGLLEIDGLFTCFVLEDESQTVKIAGETRIPEGLYRVGLYYSPTHSPAYGHDMLTITDVPGFTGILIHKGNTKADTAGCLLVGNHSMLNPYGASRIAESTLAYERVYPLIAQAVPDGVMISVETLK